MIVGRALLIATLITGIGTAACETCQTALAFGILAERDGTLGLRPEAGGEVSPITFPRGLSVQTRDGRLVVTDIFGNVKAREGDYVEMGGGGGADGVFHGCGSFTVNDRTVETVTPAG